MGAQRAAGSAGRESLREDVDFVVLPADAARADIERLRATGRIYPIERQRGDSHRT